MVAFVNLQHILHVHGPYFARQYGSLGIWSTQGMERSHWQARCAYQRSTQHGGGVNKSNPMKQLCQWWYRRIQVRAEARIKLGESTVSRALQEVRSSRRRAIYDCSEGRQNHANWVRQQQRQGRVWKKK